MASATTTLSTSTLELTPEGGVLYHTTPEQFLQLLPELTSMFPGSCLERVQAPSKQDRVACLCKEWAFTAASFSLEEDERCNCSFSASQEGIVGYYSTTSGTRLRVEGKPLHGHWSCHSMERGHEWVEPEHRLRFSIEIPAHRRDGNHDRTIREVLGLPV